MKPKGLTKDASEHWDVVVPGLVETGVATIADQSALEELCRWWAKLQTLHRRREQDSKTIHDASKCYHCWRDLAARFGLTPSDRAKIQVGEKESHDPAAKYLA